jgi:cytochrome oxidase assembly protein ShyY1
MQKHLKTVALALLLILAAVTCFELGLWQLHRAQGMAKLQKVQPERSVVELTNAASAGSNLRNTAFNRLVTFEATFEKDYVAPNQLVTLIDGTKVRKDVIVSLARLTNQKAVLVVRGLFTGSFPPKSAAARINGRLYARQNIDQAEGGAGKLSRIDPALVAGDTGFNLFDGYVIQSGGEIAAPQLLSQGGAFYWQHIAYVITWWFMGLLILSFPFYNRFRSVNAKSE